MVKYEKEITEYIQYAEELKTVKEKAESLGTSAQKLAELAEFIAGSVEYSENDVPCEADELLHRFFDMERAEFAKATKEAFGKLSIEYTAQNIEFLKKVRQSSDSDEVLRNALILKIAQLAAVFNVFSDYMVKAIAKVSYNCDGDEINSLCNENEEAMFAEYIKQSTVLFKEYRKIAKSE